MKTTMTMMLLSGDLQQKKKSSVCELCNSGVRVGVQFTSCNNLVHSKCLERLVKEKGIDAKQWKCDYCSELLTENSAVKVNTGMLIQENNHLKMQNNTLNKLIKQLENVNKLQEEKITNMELLLSASNKTECINSLTTDIQMPLYSDISKKSKQENTFFILPTHKNQNINTNNVMNLIKPGDLNVQVNNIKNITKGGVVVNCNDKESLEKLQQNLEANSNFKIQPPLVLWVLECAF
ncbi:unnamed protein product [Brassicogethes aeneus]|uniref:PHD-type domain-containing protein n=1 Tax=Brassicogethes aeneus TaxID=1431903 RepID=A0A9P0BB13_BRAAE|nr:unnamed protein product [Brassicogethes aeneus]